MLFLSIFVPTVAAKEDQACKSYPIPISEFKQVMTKWLDREGYDIVYRQLEMGIIQITCSRARQDWTVILWPRSALATEITVTHFGNKDSPTAFEKELLAYMDGYLQLNLGNGAGTAHSSNIPEAVFSKADAVVCIQTEFNHQDIQFSGFFIDEKGTVICTTHDLRQFRKITITDSQGRSHRGELIKFDTGIDLALIRTNSKPRTYVSFSKGKQTVTKGSAIYAIGCPENQSNTIVVGMVNRLPVRANELVYWQVDMEIDPGSSGSPVFDRQGELVGMIKGRHRGDKTIGFLIPTDRMAHFINES